MTVLGAFSILPNICGISWLLQSPESIPTANSFLCLSLLLTPLTLHLHTHTHTHSTDSEEHLYRSVTKVKFNYLIIDMLFFSRTVKVSVQLEGFAYLQYLSFAIFFFSSNCSKMPFDFPASRGRGNKLPSFVSLPNKWGFAWYFVKILGSFCEIIIRKYSIHCSLYNADSHLNANYVIKNNTACNILIFVRTEVCL